MYRIGLRTLHLAMIGGAGRIQTIPDMRWEDFHLSDNVEDDREGGDGRRRRLRLSGRARRPRHRHHGCARLDRLGAWHPSDVLIGGAELISAAAAVTSSVRHRARQRNAGDRSGECVEAVLGNTRTLQRNFRASGRRDRAAPLRLYSGGEQGGCGFAKRPQGVLCPATSASTSIPRSSARSRSASTAAAARPANLPRPM